MSYAMTPLVMIAELDARIISLEQMVAETLQQAITTSRRNAFMGMQPRRRPCRRRQSRVRFQLNDMDDKENICSIGRGIKDELYHSTLTFVMDPKLLCTRSDTSTDASDAGHRGGVHAQSDIKPGEGPAGLVLVPSRELAVQVAEQYRRFERHTDIKCMDVVGGQEIFKHVYELGGRVDVIVATPGRLIDLLKTRQTNLLRTTFLVIDEADDMLDKSEEEIHEILTQIRPDRQVLLFSATWQERLTQAVVSGVLASRQARCAQDPKPVEIHVGSTTVTACKDRGGGSRTLARRGAGPPAPRPPRQRGSSRRYARR
ncbi:unnamed protein product [Prorocentrum cordatum]|uniref:Helicase ATP-binding domain-containing protein n=1 Tax=Prorocentrum cordatum TaxID=2364126 RepID=A0ABN9SW26_9DINO|nr:unnamed protein product [Polarella glacialis]